MDEGLLLSYTQPIWPQKIWNSGGGKIQFATLENNVQSKIKSAFLIFHID